jgi:hypothetical protein
LEEISAQIATASSSCPHENEKWWTEKRGTGEAKSILLLLDLLQRGGDLQEEATAMTGWSYYLVSSA